MTLFENLFSDGNQHSAIETISSGVLVVIEHVAELLAESAFLLRGHYQARTELLLTAANEELGKAHLLIDAGRLNVRSHQSQLRSLCGAFYGHLEKYAYMRMWRFRPRYSSSFAEVGKRFRSDMERIEPGSPDPEDGEFDMPHPTYFSRDSNLYVDFSDYAKDWIKPTSHNPNAVEMLKDPLEWAHDHLAEWLKLKDADALRPQALSRLNAAWRSRKALHPAADLRSIAALQSLSAQNVSRVCSLSVEAILESPLCAIPCYPFLAHRKTV
ncbi:MAG: AbiV family abortive infection protein [Candidatus Binatia bacterium]